MALPVIEEELRSLDRSQWSALVSELPLFPPDSHPPPTLFPLLSPLLQQKLGLLSLSRGRGWPGTLTWLPADLSYKVNERLRNSLRLDGLEEQFRGYRRFDQETILASVALRKPNLELWFCWISPQQTEDRPGGWKLHDIRLPEVDTDMNWFETITEATERFTGNGRSENAVNGDEQSDDDDAYWNQYDQVTGIQVTRERAPSASEDHKQSQPSVSNDAYFDQYDNVETTIGDSGLMQESAANAEKRTADDGTFSGEGPSASGPMDIGLDEYVRDTVRNLSRFALRCGMSRAQLAALIKEELN